VQRRRLLLGLAGLGAWVFGSHLGARTAAGAAAADAGREPAFAPLRKTHAQWRELLDEAAFDVLFRHATERAFSSPLHAEARSGTYVCAACLLPLFSSEAKYDSGTGWPSFWQPIAPDRVRTRRDFKLIIPRTEYHCARCGGHQGHVFRDGPPPTRQRWCNNGVALCFVAASASLPPLRS
jgi:peptide-methionine (R)-S-oxide reductase